MLSLVTFLPLAGALAMFFLVRDEDKELSRRAALGVSIATFVMSLVLYTKFDTATAEMQFLEEIDWIPSL
ncbi:MAG: NADH-quinone oxidoreductase subunit M, partial [Magnetococcales bacterium]|nr:NADH-quinone oxidoreductase subunit M [Magnetococcales bacterium]